MSLKINGASFQKSQRAIGNQDSTLKGPVHKLTPRPSTQAAVGKAPGPLVKIYYLRVCAGGAEICGNFAPGTEVLADTIFLDSPMLMVTSLDALHLLS